MSDDAKLLRRQQYRRGRRKGAKGIKTGASVSRREARRHDELREQEVRPAARERREAAGRQAEADADSLDPLPYSPTWRFDLEAMTMEPLGNASFQNALRQLRLERDRAGEDAWHWQAHQRSGGRLDPLTEFALNEARAQGRTRLELQVDSRRAQYLNKNRDRFAARLAERQALEARGRGRGRHGRRRNRGGGGSSPSSPSAAVEEAAGAAAAVPTHRTWRSAAAAAHHRRKTADHRSVVAVTRPNYYLAPGERISGKRVLDEALMRADSFDFDSI